MRLGIGLGLVKYRGGGVSAPDAATTAYSAAVTAASGTISAGALSAIDAFIKGCKTDGTWDQVDYILPLAGDQLAAARVPLKTPTGTLTSATNVSSAFQAADYAATKGLTGNGTTKSLLTTFSPAAGRTSADNHMAVYLSDWTGNYSATNIAIGNNAGPANFITVKPSQSANELAGSGTTTTPDIPLPAVGLLSSGYTGAGGAVYWRGSSLAALGTAGTWPTTVYALFAVGPAGTSFRSPVTLGFASFGGGLTAAQQALYSARVETLMTALGRAPDATATLNDLDHVLTVGQSLATASNTGQPSIAGPTGAGARCWMFQAGTNPGSPANSLLYPLRDWKNGVSPSFQTIGGAFGLQMAGLLPAGKDILFSVAALGGAGYSTIAKGTATYTTGLAQMDAGVGAKASGKAERVSAIFCVHGETDDLNVNLSYGANLATWRTDLATDAKAHTGQLTDPPFFFSQMNSWTKWSSRSTPVSAPQQLAAHVADPTRMILVGPKYMMPTQDGTHITAASSNWLGEYHAKAYKAVVIDGGSFSPLRPLSVTRSGADITIVFNKGGLTFDATLVTDPAGTYASRKFGTAAGSATDTTVTNKLGFEFCDDNTTNPSVSISGFNGQALVVANINANFGTTNVAGDTLTVNLSGTPTAANKRIRYAWTGTNGANGGPTTGARGCLRDADTSFASVLGNTLYNWCVTYDGDAS